MRGGIYERWDLSVVFNLVSNKWGKPQTLHKMNSTQIISTFTELLRSRSHLTVSFQCFNMFYFLCSVAHSCVKLVDTSSCGGLMKYFHIFLDQCQSKSSLKGHTQKLNLNLQLVFFVIVVIESSYNLVIVTLKSDLTFKFLS